MRKFINELGAVFDPATVRILIGAFDDAWASLQNSGAPFAAENYAAPEMWIGTDWTN